MPYTEQGLPFAGESNTSRKAAVHIESNRRHKVANLRDAYKAAGARGLTDAEASHATGFLRQSICSLRNALMDTGLVGKGGERLGDFKVMNTVFVWIGQR